MPSLKHSFLLSYKTFPQSNQYPFNEEKGEAFPVALQTWNVLPPHCGSRISRGSPINTGHFMVPSEKPCEKLWLLLIQTSSSASACGWPFEVWAADLLLEQNGLVLPQPVAPGQPEPSEDKPSHIHPSTKLPEGVMESTGKALKKSVQSPVNWNCKALPPVCAGEWTARSESQNINVTSHDTSVQERQC